jgi:hypothetical protein
MSSRDTVIADAAFFRRMAGFFAAGAFDVFDSVRFAGILRPLST